MVHLKKESKVITDGAEGRNKCRAETEKSRNDGQKGLSGGGHWKWGEDGNWLHFRGLQNHCGQWCSHEIKTPAPWKKSYDKPKQHIKKQRHHFANKGPYSQSYGFSSSHIRICELDHKEDWAPKNWCFWTVMLEKTRESPLHCKETKPVNLKGYQLWIFIGRIDAEAPILWPPDAKNRLIWKDPDARKDWGREEKGTTENEMAGWHHWLNGQGLSKLQELVMDREACCAVCSPWGRKESNTTE